MEFCVSPGGQMEGLSTIDAINCQRVTWEASHLCPWTQGEHSTNPGTTSPATKVKKVWISGIHYHPDP